jgi:glutamate synthase (NADPH/NADH) small chain
VERIVWQRNTGVPPFDLVAGTEEARPAELVLLAMGFLGPEQHLVDGLGAERDERGNLAAPRFATSVPGVFAAGDARRGQSLIVWAIDEGRRCADAVREWLDGTDSRAQRVAFASIASGADGE